MKSKMKEGYFCGRVIFPESGEQNYIVQNLDSYGCMGFNSLKDMGRYIARHKKDIGNLHYKVPNNEVENKINSSRTKEQGLVKCLFEELVLKERDILERAILEALKGK